MAISDYSWLRHRAAKAGTVSLIDYSLELGISDISVGCGCGCCWVILANIRIGNSREYSPARRQVSLSSKSQSQLSQLHDPSGHRDVVCKTQNSHILAISILGLLTLLDDKLQHAAELSPISRQVTMVGFDGCSDVEGLIAISLISTSSALGNKRSNPLELERMVTSLDQVHTLDNVVPAPTTVGQPPRKGSSDWNTPRSCSDR
ncbi:hypothetical protein Tco_0977062 [Tanacetum coccineum]|uniref:Uncharacterized protein n=1 Tax=Tanacetum coccineum TaxID=301880 RepID=A0ABQ5EJ21_9ASTR